MTVIGIPFAAIYALVIDGTIWKLLRKGRFSHSFNSIIAAGMSAAIPTLFTEAYQLLKINSPLYLGSFDLIPIGFVIFLAAWCGWLGERLARRHV